jgi:hypothetical protein
MKSVQPVRPGFQVAAVQRRPRRIRIRRVSDLETAVASKVLQALALDLAGGDPSRLSYQREPDGSVSCVVVNRSRAGRAS